MSSAISVTCQFYVFYFISTIGHICSAHRALSWCMLYLTDRGMCNLDISIVHQLYWSTQFLFIHYLAILVLFGLMLTPLYSVYLFYFILFCPFAKIILCILPSYAMSYFRIILFSSCSFSLFYKLYLRGEM